MSVEPLPREAEGTGRGPSIGDWGYQMAILTANHGHVHTGMFPKLVPYRQMPGGQRERIWKSGKVFVPIQGLGGGGGIKTGRREVTRKTIPGKGENPGGQGGIQNQDHLSSLVNHSPGFYLRNLIKNPNI